jgi:hypothetical protein
MDNRLGSTMARRTWACRMRRMTSKPAALSQSTFDRMALSVARLGDEADRRTYWHSRTPQARLRHVELLRRLNHGSKATARLQRVLEVVRFPKDR